MAPWRSLESIDEQIRAGQHPEVLATATNVIQGPRRVRSQFRKRRQSIAAVG